MLAEYQKSFIRFLLSSGALQFGDFTLKSGRRAPYFINAASFNDGPLITELGSYYAAHIVNSGLNPIDNIFGPAYKGIPLAIASSMALHREHNITCGYSFDRKEVKQHGDGGKIVGKRISDKSRIVIVEDVVTAGTTLLEVIPALRAMAEVEIAAVIISVDRQERGTGSQSAVSEIKSKLDVQVLPIVTITQIIDYLTGQEAGIHKLTSDILDKIKSYRAEFGA